MLNLIEPLPDEGVQVPIRATFTGVAGIPLLALGTNSLFPIFKLFNDYIECRVFLRQRHAYAEIKEVHVFQTFMTNNVKITWHNTPFTLAANVRDPEDLIEVVRFLKRKQVPLTETAERLLQGR